MVVEEFDCHFSQFGSMESKITQMLKNATFVRSSKVHTDTIFMAIGMDRWFFLLQRDRTIQKIIFARLVDSQQTAEFMNSEKMFCLQKGDTIRYGKGNYGIFGESILPITEESRGNNYLSFHDFNNSTRLCEEAEFISSFELLTEEDTLDDKLLTPEWYGVSRGRLAGSKFPSANY